MPWPQREKVRNVVFHHKAVPTNDFSNDADSNAVSLIRKLLPVTSVLTDLVIKVLHFNNK